jgi:hypothetical protein
MHTRPTVCRRRRMDSGLPSRVLRKQSFARRRSERGIGVIEPELKVEARAAIGAEISTRRGSKRGSSRGRVSALFDLTCDASLGLPNAAPLLCYTVQQQSTREQRKAVPTRDLVSSAPIIRDLNQVPTHPRAAAAVSSHLQNA